MEEDIVELQIGRKPSHYIIYRNKRFPIFLKIFSTFAHINEDQIHQNASIPLLSQDDEINISINDNSIENFILYCHNRDYEINNQNAVFLNFLGKKYSVQELIEETEEYITNHPDVQEIQIQQISISESLTDESSVNQIVNISQNLIEIITTNQSDIIELPISKIHLILTKYFASNNYSEENDHIVIEFLFNCLNKYGRSASPLFSLIDFGEKPSEYIGRLINDYWQIFDFHFINPLFLKTIYEQNNEIIQQKLEFEMKIENCTKAIDQLKEMICKNNEKMIGSFFYSVRQEDDLDGAIKCNGQEIDVNKYPRFVEEYLKNGKIQSIPFSQWEGMKRSVGNVGIFGYEMNSNKFIAPLIQAGTYLSNADGSFLSQEKQITPKQGEFAQDQIVNIKGGFDWAAGAQGQTEVWHANGPFKPAVNIKAPAPEQKGIYVSVHPRGISFDSSLVVRTGDRVMPKTVFQNLYVVVSSEYQLFPQA